MLAQRTQFVFVNINLLCAFAPLRGNLFRRTYNFSRKSTTFWHGLNSISVFPDSAARRNRNRRFCFIRQAQFRQRRLSTIERGLGQDPISTRCEIIQRNLSIGSHCGSVEAQHVVSLFTFRRNQVNKQFLGNRFPFAQRKLPAKRGRAVSKCDGQSCEAIACRYRGPGLHRIDWFGRRCPRA